MFMFVLASLQKYLQVAKHFNHIYFMVLLSRTMVSCLTIITQKSKQLHIPCQVGLMVSVYASHTVGREFASRPGHTKHHHKNGTNCLPAWHAMR